MCILRTSPVYDRRSQPLGALRLQFKAGLGGPLGDGSQYVPMISARDWVDAVVHLAESDTAQGPFNLCCEQVPTNEELTRALAHQVNRPAFFRVPSVGPAHRCRARWLPSCSTRSTPTPPRCWPAASRFRDPDVSAVIREGLDPSH